MNRSLLLISSDIFDGSSLIDRINQSYIDLESNPSQEEVEVLFEEHILIYLEKKLYNPTAESLFALIMSCFKHYPSLVSPIFNKFFTKSRINSNFIIITASILSNFPDQCINQDTINFAIQALDQLKPQIKNTKQTTFKIFDHEISSNFIPGLISDLLLIAPLTPDMITNFYSFLFLLHLIQSPTIAVKLVSRAFEFNLSTILPHESINYILKENKFSEIPIEIFDRFLLNLNETDFKLFHREILDEILIDPSKYSTQVITTYIQKFCQNNIKNKKIEKLASLITKDQISIELYKYLIQCNIKLPHEKVIDLIGTLDDNDIVKIIPSLKYCDKPPLNEIIFRCNDLKSYECLFSTKFDLKDCDFVFKQEFWNHIFEVASDNKNKYSDKTIYKLAIVLKKFNNYQLVKNICKNMIFSTPELTKNGIYFIKNLSNKLKVFKIKILDHKLIKELLLNIQQKGIIPIPYFWQLIPTKYIYDELQKEQKPLFLYGYEFSNKNLFYFPNKTDLSIMNQTKDSLNKVLEFLQQESFNYIVNMNEEALSLISCAFIFTSNVDEAKVNGLTKENILPFFALGFKFKLKRGGNLKFSSNEIESTFCEAIDGLSNNESVLLNNSIDIILSSFSSVLTDFPFNLVYKMIDTLALFMFENNYKANKLLLLSTIFAFSNIAPFNDLVKSFFDKNGDKLIEFILSKSPEIIKNDKFKSNLLNFNYFNKEKTCKKLVDLATNDISNTIYFLENNCKNITSLEFEKSNFFNNENLRQKFLSLKENNCKVPIERIIQNTPELVDIDDLLSYILNCKAPENQDKPFEILFNILMKDEAIALDYFTIALDQIDVKQSINPGGFNYTFFDEYKKNKDIFIKAFSRLYVMNPENQSFNRKLEYKEQFSSYSKLSSDIISKIYKAIEDKPNNFKAFYCLKDIACSFPFLFSDNPQKVIDLVLPYLNAPEFFTYINDNDYLKKERKNKDEKNKFKTLVCALSFFNSTLYSIKILEYFLTWFSDNISNLSDSQAYFFILNINSLKFFKNHKFLLPILKNDIFNKYKILLDRNNQTLSKEIYKFMCEYYISLFYAPDYIKLTRDMLKDISNPLSIVFDHFPTHSTNINSFKSRINLSYKSDKNYILKIFQFYMKKINELKPYYFIKPDLFYMFSYTRNNEEIADFLDNYNRLNPNSQPTLISQFEHIQVPEPLTSNMIRYIAFKPTWIFNYIYYIGNNYLYPKNLKIISKVIDDLKQIQINDGDDEIYEVRLNEFYDYQDEILQFLIQNNNIYYFLSDISLHDNKYFSKNPYLFLDLFYKIIDFLYYSDEQYITNNMYNDIDDSFNKISNIFYLIILSDRFKDDEKDQIIEKFLDVILLPKYRTNNQIFKNAVLYFKYFYSENKCEKKNKRLIHLICFIIIYNINLFENAIELSENIDPKILEIAIPYFEIGFDQIMSSTLKEDKYKKQKIVYLILKHLPKIGETRMNLIYEFLSESMNELDYLISQILNLLAPKRSEFDKFSMSDSKIYAPNESIYKQKNSLRPVPEYLINNSRFWKLISDHYDDFMKIYNESPTNFYAYYTFFLYYPEIVSFQKRSSFFLYKMSKKIIFNYTYVNVDRNDIIESSFQSLNSRKKQDLLSIFNVKFVDEQEAIDAGGVKKDWITNLIKELINTKNKLFITTETGNYYPNPFSGVKQNHLEYFRFAGKMIAFALINNICVDAHFAPFFFKHLLNYKIKLNDLKGYSENVYNSFCYILQNDVNDLDMRFEVDVDENGKPKTIELIKNGSQIKVTNENKHEFIEKSLHFYLSDSIKQQTDAFCNGFHSLISVRELSIFSQGELELLICGVTKIDINDMRNNTSLFQYTRDSPTIKCFFNAISKWDNDLLAQLLQFITGNSSVPLNGFCDKRIIIQKSGNINSLPTSHTCFNILDLPDYQNEEILNEKLLMAVKECKTFGFI